MGDPTDPEGPTDSDAKPSRKALVFDDNPAIGVISVARLNELGFEARSVVAKAAFLEALLSWRPELILLDLSLGDTDAIELFGLLREQNFVGHVILMSGHSGSMLDHARRLGEGAGIAMGGVLEKPFRQRDLSALIGKLDTASKPTPAVNSNEPNPFLLRDALIRHMQRECTRLEQANQPDTRGPKARFHALSFVLKKEINHGITL